MLSFQYQYRPIQVYTILRIALPPSSPLLAVIIEIGFPAFSSSRSPLLAVIIGTIFPAFSSPLFAVRSTFLDTPTFCPVLPLYSTFSALFAHL
jgi:hypothetical protein